MKRNLIIVLIFVLAAIVGVVFFMKSDVSFARETSIFRAVPFSAPVFIEMKNIKSIPFDISLVQELTENGNVAKFSGWIEKLNKAISENNEIQNGLRNDPFILVFDFIGENEIYPLVIKHAESTNIKNSLKKLVQTMFSAEEYNNEQKEYNGHKVISVTSLNTSQSVYFSFADGLFLASTKLLLVEKSLRQLGAESIDTDLNFSQVNKTVSAQSNISLFINHHSFPILISKWLNRKSVTSANEFGEPESHNLARDIRAFENFAAWSELDVVFSENEILLNGVSAANDSLNHFLTVFDGQQPVRFQAPDLLPSNTSFFTSYTFSDKSIFFKELEKYFTHTASYYRREDRIKKIESLFRADLKTTFQEIVEKEIIVATTNIPVQPENKTTLFLLQTTGKTNAEKLLNNLLGSYAQQKKIEPESLKKTFEFDKEISFSIYNFPFPSFPGIWLGRPFGFVDANYFAFFQNYIVFANSEAGLQDYLHNMTLDATLSKDMRYADFSKKMASKTNINTFINVNRIFNIKNEVFNPENVSLFDKNEAYLRKFEALNWQVIVEKGVFFNTVYTTFNKEKPEEARTFWKSNIGHNVVSKPIMVADYNSPGNQDILVFSEKNKLFQLTKDGRNRWNITIDGPILSEIHQIDYFRNGKLQYLFNTKSKLYLIDREGNNVAHFPVSFRSPATNGVNVFDYDNNRKYRYFVACEDKKVYAFDTDGKLVTGWKFNQTDFQVTTPVQHFRVANKDYIVFKDKSQVYVQDRQGNTRVKMLAEFENSQNPLVLNLNGTPKIVATDNSGKVFYLYFDGKFAEKKTARFSENHSFTVDDLNGNEIPDFVFIDGNELTVMDENGKILFTEKFKNIIRHPPNIHMFSSKLKKIGIVDSEANRIYLFAHDGKLHKGFPLQGSSEFSIGKLSQKSDRFNLVVGSKGRSLICYELE